LINSNGFQSWGAAYLEACAKIFVNSSSRLIESFIGRGAVVKILTIVHGARQFPPDLK
jgi:hypothetical protein